MMIGQDGQWQIDNDGHGQASEANDELMIRIIGDSCVCVRPCVCLLVHVFVFACSCVIHIVYVFVCIEEAKQGRG